MKRCFRWLAVLGTAFLFYAGCGDESQSSILILPSAVNFGKVRQQELPIQASFQIENRGCRDVEIAQITPTCQCAVTKMSNRIIPAGQRITVPVYVDVRERSGNFQQSLMIETKLPSKIFVVDVVGTVVTDVWCNTSDIRGVVEQGQTESVVTFTLHTVDHPNVEFDWSSLDKSMSIKEVS